MKRLKHRLWQAAALFVATMVSGSSTITAQPLRVTTTTTDLAALVEFLGGDRVAVHALARPLQDPHFLDATPGMVVRVSRSGLVVSNGAELEIGWLPEVLRQTRNRAVRVGAAGYVDASAGVELIQVPEVITRDQGDVHPSGNPHYTLEPLVAAGAARAIVQGLSRVDPDGSALYERALERYREEAAAVVNHWRERFEPHCGCGVIVYHRHFDYMLKSLGLEIVDTIEPLPGLAPSARHLASLIDRYDSDSVRLVLMEPWQDRRVAERLAEALGVPLVVGCPGVGACPEAADLFSLFELNAARLLQALEANPATGG